MPEFGGAATFEELCRIDPSVTVLLSSGYSAEGQAKSIIQNGCKGFIQKPFTLTALSRKIRTTLKKKHTPADALMSMDDEAAVQALKA
jgi:two-component system, cell cycle sensor histidine kinase and response regulator CckA